jgi:tRNA-specific adenosine deaminase 1
MAILKSKSANFAEQTGLLRGRNGYTNFGAIRTKPGRTDSQISISMSCSDKLASWCALGLQGALLSEIFEPVYLDGVVVGGVEEDAPDGWGREGMEWRDVIRDEVKRALYGRLECIESKSTSHSSGVYPADNVLR